MQKLGARFAERLNRSAFFFGAVLCHLLLFLMFVGYVVWQPAPPEKETGFEPVAAQITPPQPPPAPKNVTPDQSGGPMGLRDLHTEAPTPNYATSLKPDVFDGHDMAPGVQPGHDPGLVAHVQLEIGNPSPVDLPGVKRAQKGWHPDGDSTKFVVPIYLAKYADGDWDCNAYLHDGQLVSGCLPNLMAKIKEWSNGEIEGRDLKVVALDSPQILSDPPPFIFFTGHKDFHLTPAEVTNLQKYLQIGGCIWGDSAFSGDGSRFDVAFHREMKRVLPDADLNFGPLPADHDIFMKSSFVLDAMPQGMNRHADPIEYINLGDKIAIIYTPNDYSDMMTMLLLPGRNEREARMDGWGHWEPQHPLFTPGEFAGHAATYFRNYSPSSAMTSYKLSMNILIYLLHRYDDELLLTP